jgi:RNA polymerase sigma-70 factor (ECF subfamily)
MPTDPYGLTELLARVRSGDDAALNDLFGQLRPFVRALVRRRIADDEAASDLTQDILLKMFRGWPNFRGDSVPGLLAWVRQITARTLIDFGRVTTPHHAPLPDVRDDHVETPEATLERDEEMTRLLAAIERLRPEYRQVVEMRMIDGLKSAAIAERLGRTEVWVRVTFKRAVDELARRLGE